MQRTIVLDNQSFCTEAHSARALAQLLWRQSQPVNRPSASRQALHQTAPAHGVRKQRELPSAGSEEPRCDTSRRRRRQRRRRMPVSKPGAASDLHNHQQALSVPAQLQASRTVDRRTLARLVSSCSLQAPDVPRVLQGGPIAARGLACKGRRPPLTGHAVAKRRTWHQCP